MIPITQCNFAKTWDVYGCPAPLILHISRLILPIHWRVIHTCMYHLCFKLTLMKPDYMQGSLDYMSKRRVYFTTARAQLACGLCCQESLKLRYGERHRTGIAEASLIRD